MSKRSGPRKLTIGENDGTLLRIDKKTARKAWRLCVPVLAVPSATPDAEAKPVPGTDIVLSCGDEALDEAVRAAWPGRGLIGIRYFTPKLDSYVLHIEFTDGSNPYLAYVKDLPTFLRTVVTWTRGYELERRALAPKNQFGYRATLRHIDLDKKHTRYLERHK